MKRTLYLILVLGVAATAPTGWAASDETAPPATTTAAADSQDEQKPTATPEVNEAAAAPFLIRHLDFGVQGVETDTNSSRFQEYRSLPNGIILPYLRFAGNKKFWYDIVGVNVLQSDAQYRVDVRPWNLDIKASYIKIPHRFGNDGHTLLEEHGTGNWIMSDTLQQTFQNAIQTQFNTNKNNIAYPFLNSLVSPSFVASNTVDLALLRERGQVDVKLLHDSPLDIHATYFHENRRGTRAAGTSFGFGNVVETPEAIQYRTQDYGLTAEYDKAWGLIRGAFHYNDFTDRVTAQTFDNPFRATDSTDASAYTAPGSGSIAGPSFGRVALPPGNTATTGSLGFLVKFAGHSRLTADATLGDWKQNDVFIPMTSNTAIALPNQNLPGSLDGSIRTTSLLAQLTSRPIDHLNLTARFRRYDLDNRSPRVSFPVGYVRFDGVFEAIPRITVPYGNTTDGLVLSAAYDFGTSVTVEGGYRLDIVDRTFRETEKTTQNTGFAKLDVRAAQWLVFHGTFEKGSRNFDGLEIGNSEDASQLQPGAPGNLLAVPSNTLQSNGSPLCTAGTVCNLRYDQAPKDLDRYAAIAELTPDSGKTTLMLSYIKGKDDYKDSTFGLINGDNQSFTAEVDYNATERVNLSAFYSREKISSFQRGRQSGASVSTSSLDDWTSSIEDKVDSFGGGVTFGVVKDKADLKLYGNYQKVDGNNAIASPVGGAPEMARRAIGGVQSIPNFDDTKLYTVSAELVYKLTQQLRLAAGGWYQAYTLTDSATTGLINYVPASMFLAADDSNYKAHVLYLRMTYVW
jgi:MtrB/PioB family decaheme-associated outer membrane protein